MADFLGAGWPTPLQLDSEGHIALAEADAAVRQSIWMILSTAPGERLMRPSFGCGIHDLVFAPINAATVGQISGLVMRSLIDWEPRIDVLDIDVGQEPERPHCLLIQISYRVRTTNNRFNLVYPFYVD
jgi:phage baseplate assembly protein W